MTSIAVGLPQRRHQAVWQCCLKSGYHSIWVHCQHELCTARTLLSSCGVRDSAPIAARSVTNVSPAPVSPHCATMAVSTGRSRAASQQLAGNCRSGCKLCPANPALQKSSMLLLVAKLWQLCDADLAMFSAFDQARIEPTALTLLSMPDEMLQPCA